MGTAYGACLASASQLEPLFADGFVTINLAGIFAGEASGEGGMTTASALSGYTFGFWALMAAGVVLFLAAPLVSKFMHGVK